jgi:aspartate aminotransferase-like enzyme
MMDKLKTIEEFVVEKNHSKLLFTAGPASLLAENITGLRPCFGRGDQDYADVENKVLDKLLSFTGHHKIARLQGSASLGIEIAILNFLFGRVLVVSTGFYSDRLKMLAQTASIQAGNITEIKEVNWQEIEFVNEQFDWVVSCSTETSCGLKIPIDILDKLTARVGGKLMLDATASIGLETNHNLAEVVMYSSCKGLFGLTGAAFIAFNSMPEVEINSFYLNIHTHLQKKVTGPYHAIASLSDVLPCHEQFRAAVIENKKYFQRKAFDYLTLPIENQPLLCTHVSCKIESTDSRAILYEPRDLMSGSVICHLGEVHLGYDARGKIFDAITLTQR